MNERIPLVKGDARSLFGFPLTPDETLPPDYVKIVSAGSALIFRLDRQTETAEIVAMWPEEAQ